MIGDERVYDKAAVVVPLEDVDYVRMMGGARGGYGCVVVFLCWRSHSCRYQVIPGSHISLREILIVCKTRQDRLPAPRLLHVPPSSIKATPHTYMAKREKGR